MTFNNAVNGSNTDFELSSGTFQFANRDRLQPGHCENIGIAYSAGTFTVRGSNASLSASNPGYIVLQSKATPGNLVKYTITANQTFTDGSAGTTDNQRFGLTTGVNASVDIPFYLYAVGNDAENTINFMIGRVPHHIVSPAAAKIGKTGAVVNVSQSDMFSLSNITVADYDGNPCICIGSFRMQFTGATDSWTVQTLTNFDGIGEFQESTQFFQARGQFGAAAGKLFANNGGTAPDDADGLVGYYVSKNGRCLMKVAFPAIDTAGVGAVQSIQILPLAADGSVNFFGYLNNGIVYALTIGATSTNFSSNLDKLAQTSNAGNGLLINDNFILNSEWAGQTNYFISLT